MSRRRASDQFTMLDTDLSIAVDKVIELDEEKRAMQEDIDKAGGELMDAMLKAGKPEIKHSKGYVFRVDSEPAHSKLKIQRPPKV